VNHILFQTENGGATKLTRVIV